MQVLELFSGIGGMHMALRGVSSDFKVVKAVDINDVANMVYRHNFPDTEVVNLNILALNAETIHNWNVDTILMSPPCQPFSRNGRRKDISDLRNDAFRHILNLLTYLHSIKRILIENVKGFETSEMHALCFTTLTNLGYHFSEFLLTPSKFGIPNSRMRYYCIASKDHALDSSKIFSELTQSPLWNTIPFELSEIIEVDPDPKCFIKADVVRRFGRVMDIRYMSSKGSCCFTKSYTRFIEGTGSVLCGRTEAYMKQCLEAEPFESMDDDTINSFRLRFFSPREIAKLMGFPADFNFPTHITEKQKYMLLGNSVNVLVVQELLKLLV